MDVGTVDALVSRVERRLDQTGSLATDTAPEMASMTGFPNGREPGGSSKNGDSRLSGVLHTRAMLVT